MNPEKLFAQDRLFIYGKCRSAENTVKNRKAAYVTSNVKKKRNIACSGTRTGQSAIPITRTLLTPGTRLLQGKQDLRFLRPRIGREEGAGLGTFLIMTSSPRARARARGHQLRSKVVTCYLADPTPWQRRRAKLPSLP